MPFNRPANRLAPRRPGHTSLRIVATLVLGLSLVLFIGGRPASASPATTTRAMWVWATPATPADAVAFAVDQGVSRLFVAVPPNVTSSPALPAITAFVQQAQAAGLRVDALGGDPGWVDNPTWVVDNWLTPALATGLFAGIHVDIEPYSTPAWTTNRAAVVKKWLNTLDVLRSAAGGRPLEADVPFWANQIPAGNQSTLSREILKRTSGVSVMAYRNAALGTDGTLSLAAAVLSDGDALGKPVRIGQETTYLGSDPVETKQTFYGFTRTAMDEQLALVDSGAAAHPRYAGIAIHDLQGYAALVP